MTEPTSTPLEVRPEADRYFVKADQSVARPLFPGIAIQATAGDAMMLSLVTFEPGADLPEHAHPHEQMGMMISGRLEFTVGGQTRILETGDIWRIPGSVPHKVRALDGPAVALDVFYPVREDYR